MIILGIETSCDETAAAVIEGRGDKVEVLSNVVASQIEIHQKYGGVVPEVAAREHVLNILPVVNEALEKAGIPSPCPLLLISSRERERWFRGIKRVPFSRDFKNGRKARIEGLDAIAVTVGPGLVTSLLVGVETAKTLAYAWRVPTIAVNHIEGHIYANWLKPISGNSKSQFPISKQIQNSKLQIQNNVKFPALILTVSGGHTMLILMSGHGKYKLLGETQDDAAGEAFDKAAQLLGLGYPGGPAIAEQAQQWKSQIPNPNNQTNPQSQIKNSKKINLPRPMFNSNDFDFSFSGLKTALLYEIQKDKQWRKKIPEYAAEFQQAVVDVLVAKTIRAAGEYKAKTVMLAGGVAANKELRRELELTIKEKLDKVPLLMPELKYCTDNAAMVAAAGYFRARNKKFTDWSKLRVDCNLELK